jgi:hypothetical protein
MEISDRLHWIQSKNPELIPKELNVYEECRISQSFRRGATTHARNQKVGESDIDIINWWRKVEGAQGHRPKLRMQDHYSKIRQLVPSLLRFSLLPYLKRFYCKLLLEGAIIMMTSEGRHCA